MGLVGYFVGFPFLGLMHLFANFSTRPHYEPLQLAQLIAIPLGVAFLFFTFTAIGIIVYNAVAKFGLAIEFTSNEYDRT